MEVNKGDDDNPKYRSRLFAREIRMAGEDAIFAPTPPLESLRMVFSYATTDFPNEPKKIYDPKSPHRMQVLTIDISRAHFNAVTPEDKPTFVEFPPEFCAPLDMCGLLERHMYGTRRAADGWQSEYSGTLRGFGFARGRPLRVFSDTKSASWYAPCTEMTSQSRDHVRLSAGSRHR